MTRRWRGTARARKTLRAIVVGAILTAMLFTAGPAGAMLTREPGQVAAVPVTTGSLTFTGDGYLARANPTNNYTTAGGDTFIWTAQGPRATLVVQNAGHLWQLWLQAPDDQDLAVGTYVDATREAFGNSGAGFTLFGDGRGCSSERSEFTVHRITLDADHVIQALDVSFVDHCENFLGLTRGRLVINLAPLSPLVETGAAVINGGDQFTTGQFAFASVSGDSVLGQVERVGNSIFVVMYQPLGHDFNLEANAPIGQPIAVGTTYTSTAQFPDSTHPGLSLTSINRHSCTTEVGSFTVSQLHVAADNTIDLLDLTFQRGCDGPVTTGRIVINTNGLTLTTGVTVSTTTTLTVAKLTMAAGVTGTVTCSQPARYTVSVTVSQSVLGSTVSRQATIPVNCSASTAWSAVVAFNTFSGFSAGPATVRVTATPTDPQLFAPRPAAVTSSASLLFRIQLPTRRPR